MSDSASEKKLRVAFFYPSRCVGRPIDVPNIWTSPRGLTGSEIACVMYALGLSRLGHSVTLFTRVDAPGTVEGVNFLPYEYWGGTYRHQEWDALCSWMVPDPLKWALPGQFRLLNQQVSNMNLCSPGWESHVDLLTPLSHSHAHYMADQTEFPRDRWKIMHNGVDVESFRPGDKVPGKMVWASSHDRGLHWLLEAFPRIKENVPHAHLNVFYNFEGLHRFAGMDDRNGPLYAELGQRSRYVLEAFKRLEGSGVNVHESVSRDRIREEMTSAEVLAYPCDPIHYTETFGVTVLEACASGTVPILCTSDAFGELWGSVGLNVPPPYREHKDLFVEHVTNVMSDSELRGKLARDCVAHAQAFDWPSLVGKLERCLLSRGEEGLPNVMWESGDGPSSPDTGSDMTKLNIGCGPNVFPFSGWVNYDHMDFTDHFDGIRRMPAGTVVNHEKDLAQFLRDGKVLDCRVHDLRDGFQQHPDESVDAIYLGQVIEHLNPLFEAPKLIQECRRMLRPGGVLRITTPDLDLLVKAYVDGRMGDFTDEFPSFYEGALPSDQLAYVMYGSAGPKCTWSHYEGHMHLYTEDSMSRLLRDAGFEPPFIFHRSAGKSQCPTMAKEVHDHGMGHSFISEAVRQ